MPTDPRGSVSRTSQIQNALRARIASGEWEIHSRIPGETALAAEYGVSRGTVREAMRSLIGLGMLEASAGLGTFVRSRVPSDKVLVSLLRDRGPAECLQLRAAIEGEAARTLALLCGSSDGISCQQVRHHSSIA